MRLAFMGTPEFAVPALKALLGAGHDVQAVYTQPARPAGRGQRLQPSAVARFSEAHKLPVRTPKSLSDPAEAAHLAALALDAAVVVAYGLILPRAILATPRLGCLNIHASLLPRWRGAAPIARAILAGDSESGITIMQMDEGLDTGPLLLQARAAIAPDMSAGELAEALAALGARLILEALDGLAAGRLEAKAQPQEGVTYAHKIGKAETRLEWRKPAELLARQVRAFSPSPGAWCELAGERVRVLAAEVAAAGATAPPGTALDDSLTLACGSGALRLLRLQRAGGKAMEALDYVRGRAVPAGTVLA
ncbi:MAG TPA: methionyl-tRNA formyltransferase [Alphaproteobacteria bacterium]|nr:methionyl-tRNA formyltransferase [Alphaproteobacteria bacterium]